MKFSQFVDVFVAALYSESELTGKSEFRVSEILEKYGLTLNPAWGERLFDDYTFSSRVDARRHIGPLHQQRVRLSAEGLRWVEDELGDNVATFLEQSGAFHESQRPQQLPDGMTEVTGGRVFMSDGAIPDSFEGRPGDLHFELASGEPAADSSSWTGLPKSGILGPKATEKLRIALSSVDDAVEKANCSNEERAQARAYALAIHALADAPEPPADLIWKLIERANSIAGIAALFVSLTALFANA